MIEYKMKIELKQDDFYESGEIRAGVLLHFFQEAAAQHADLLGVGWETMIEKDLAWIITKLRYRVVAPIDPDRTYYVVTRPRAKRSRICPRDYYLCDSDGREAVIGTSLWSFINFKTRKIERINFEYDGELCQKAPFEEGFERLQMKEPAKAGSYVITEKDLDTNDHTNNCRYADLVRSVSDMADIHDFVIQFSKETRLGDEILLFKETGPDSQLICGKLPDGETVFLAKLS